MRNEMANGFVSRTKAREDYNLRLNQKERLKEEEEEEEEVPRRSIIRDIN